ncbi:hypothetical protein CBI38_37290 (plasmid) [Rhodococcus oxybenzonivorans]|uniref:Uncharacterized protein n=1 Tax=Rhodococcus oxybenzonivorans TaxID=1990687 RepID=A0A2S2C882_9NOCA|nr:hypothetical protein CBI38_37290 [Rhodococcus oxybenzonivorans]
MLTVGHFDSWSKHATWPSSAFENFCRVGGTEFSDDASQFVGGLLGGRQTGCWQILAGKDVVDDIGRGQQSSYEFDGNLKLAEIERICRRREF